MDLQSRLERLGGPIEPVPADAIDADLDRGRRAVRRRRTVQTAAGSAFGVAAIVAAVAFTGAHGGVDGPDRTPAVAQVVPGNLRLVEYRGPQPKHFTVDKVPDGYFIQNDDRTGLTIAPTSVRSRPPGIDPSKAPMYDPRDLTGKIGIYLETKEYRGAVDGEQVTVAGRPAILHPIGPTWQLLISASPKVYATVQFDVALSREQMLELGAGLHVDAEAVKRAAG
jgi:hypothetical protein